MRVKSRDVCGVVLYVSLMLGKYKHEPSCELYDLETGIKSSTSQAIKEDSESMTAMPREM